MLHLSQAIAPRLRARLALAVEAGDAEEVLRVAVEACIVLGEVEEEYLPAGWVEVDPAALRHLGRRALAGLGVEVRGAVLCRGCPEYRPLRVPDPERVRSAEIVRWPGHRGACRPG